MLFFVKSAYVDGNHSDNGTGIYFLVTGLFVRYSSGHSPIMRKISDTAYWIFLVHLPLTFVGPGLLMGLALPGGVKFLIVLSTSATICWFSYIYLVRGSFIGQFLSGKKHLSTSITLVADTNKITE
jgi:hypothetical protein